MTEQNIMYVSWISIDPVRRKVDVYPKSISIRIEKEYQTRCQYTSSACILGSDFFNATVHFHPSGSQYQTTPGMSMGRCGFKQPGYRSVKRICVSEPDNSVIVYGKLVHGEWRIAYNDQDSEIEFNESIPRELWLTSNSTREKVTVITNWKPEDLTSNSYDTQVIVWQWCKGTPEHQGDLTKLSNSWWMPYNYENSNAIETSFKQKDHHVTIELPIIGERIIEFNIDNCYAKQISPDSTKVRFVRRIVKSIQEVREMFDKISMRPIDIDTIIQNLPDGSIPHHFNCPILQDIMRDPVKTIDNHVYERYAIERWFTINDTSPLTGLHLSSKVLVLHDTLKKEIDEFLEKLE